MAERNETAPDASEARDFKASDLLKLAGLTYRQLSDWENRAGVLTSQRAKEAGWRKFTAEEVLALCVCASLRRQFSLPLEKVGGLFAWLLKASEGSMEALIADLGRETLASVTAEGECLVSSWKNGTLKTPLDDGDLVWLLEYLNAVRNSWRNRPIFYAAKCAEQGETVYLYTDFEDSMILFEESMALAIAKRMPTGPVIIFPLNDLFNKVREAVGKPILPRDTLTKPLSEKWEELQSRIRITDNEREVLDLIRKKTYQRVTLRLKDGRIVRADAEEDLSMSDADKRDGGILRAIKENAFSTVTVQRTDGQIVCLKRETTFKFDKVTGKT